MPPNSLIRVKSYPLPIKNPLSDHFKISNSKRIHFRPIVMKSRSYDKNRSNKISTSEISQTINELSKDTNKKMAIPLFQINKTGQFNEYTLYL